MRSLSPSRFDFDDILESEFEKVSLNVPATAKSQLAIYGSELEHWNRTVNLTALQGAALVRRLIVEPVCVGTHLQMGGVLADVGSGNGSPGIPLCLTREFSAAHLIEPRMKRAAFLRHTVAKVGLTQVGVHRSRIEEVPENSLSTDWIVLQAIDPTVDMLSSLRRIARTTTRVVWITSVDVPPVRDAEWIIIPNIATKVWIFGLDQT